MHASSTRARLLLCEILDDVFCRDTIFTVDCKLNAENQSFCLYISPSSNSFFSFLLCFCCGACRWRKVMQMQDSLYLALKAVETFVPFNQELHEQGQKWLTLSFPQHVKFPDKRCAAAPASSIFFGPIAIHFQCCTIWWKSFQLPGRKRRQTGVKGIRFRTFTGHFWVIS